MELHKQGYDRIRAAHPEAAADEDGHCKRMPAVETAGDKPRRSRAPT